MVIKVQAKEEIKAFKVEVVFDGERTLYASDQQSWTPKDAAEIGAQEAWSHAARRTGSTRASA